MEESIIIEALKVSLQEDSGPRKQAETLFASFKSSSGFIPMLMKISLEENPIVIKQLSAIYLKNLTKVWKDSKRDFELPSHDKAFLKANIIECLRFSIPEKIRSQFEKIAYNIAKADFPWDEILEQIDVGLSSDFDHVYAALSMTYQIAKVYEFELDQKRKNLNVLIDRVFGKLNVLLETFLNETSEDSYKYIEMVLQIFWVCFYIELPQSQVSTQQLDSWLQKFKTILELPLGGLEAPSQSPEDAKLRDLNPLWSCKRWAAQITHRFFNRYFRLAYLKHNDLMIGQHFQQQWAIQIFAVILPLLYKRTSCYIPDIVINFLLKYVSQGIKFEILAEQMKTITMPNGKPVITALITDIIIPFLYRTRSEEELWQENPIEFVKKERGLSKSHFYSTKSSAIDLLLEICEKGYFSMFLEYASTELQSSPQPLQKEAILLALGSNYQNLTENLNWAENIQNILSDYVLPEFDSPIGFLRARACWMYAQFASFPFSNKEHQSLALQKICQMMLDPDLPVRIEAAIALPRLFSWEISKEKVPNEIKEILKAYIKLIGESDSEEVANALGEIVGKFSTEIIPYALDLTQHLVEIFLRISSNEGSQDEGESEMAAVSILNTITKIVSSFKERPQDLLNISYFLMPVFEYCLNEKGCEFFREAANLLTSLLYYSPKDALPHLFPLVRLLRASVLGEGNVKAYALEDAFEVFLPIANFISKYPQLTCENLDMVLTVGLGLLNDKAPEYPELMTGCKILIALLENLKGPLDQYIPEIVKQASRLYTLKIRKKIKVYASEVICVSLWNNIRVTFQAIQELNILTDLFRFGFETLDRYNNYLSRSYMVLGLASMSFWEYLPQIIAKRMPVVVKKALILWKVIKAGKGGEGEKGEGEEGEGEEEEEEEEGKVKEKEEEETEQAIEMDSDEEDDQFDETPEDLYDSPFKTFRLIKCLEGIFLNFSQICPEIYSKALLRIDKRKTRNFNRDH